MAAFDALIVGGGHNGLVAASYLAKAGVRVAVLERAEQVGGAAVTDEILPGFRVSAAAYAYARFRPRIVRELGLRRFGLETHAFDPQFFLPFPDGEALFVWLDLKRTQREIARFSKADAKAYARFGALWRRFARVVEPQLLEPPLRLADWAARFRSRLEREDLQRLLFGSATELIEEYFETEHLRAALASSSIVGTAAPPSAPGTAFCLAHLFLAEVEGHQGAWGWAKGGMGAVTQALRRAAEHFGATIRTSSEVAEILVDHGRARGVRLTSGARLEARAVLSCADPKRTLLRLLPGDALEPEVRRQVERLKSEGMSAKVLLALDALPSFKAVPGTRIGPQHRGFIDICPSLEYLERAWADAREGRPSRDPFLDIVIQSTVDPTLAPRGKHTASIFCQYTPYTPRSGSWEALREPFGDRVVEVLADYAPNLPGAVLKRVVLSPLDLERRFGLTGGHIWHLEMTPDQMYEARPLLGWAHYRTPVPGLYFGSVGTHPAGGVMGAPGHNAAKAILEDLRGRGRRQRRP